MSILDDHAAYMLKESDDVFSSYLEDVEETVCNGYRTVEVASHLTKSRLPELYSFEVEDDYNAEDDTFTTTVIF